MPVRNSQSGITSREDTTYWYFLVDLHLLVVHVLALLLAHAPNDVVDILEVPNEEMGDRSCERGVR